MSNTSMAIVQHAVGQRTERAFNDQDAIDRSRTAEIVIALCGPMGTPLHEVAEIFKTLLTGTDYQYQHVSIIRLSNEIRRLANIGDAKCSTKQLIEAGNQLRQDHGNAVLARVAIQQITLARERLNNESSSGQASLFRGDA